MARCPDPCGKHRFISEAKAQLACVYAAMTGEPGLTWYRSRACRCWHLTNPGHHGSGRGGSRGQWVSSFTPGREGAL